jgi:hypothetical protein
MLSFICGEPGCGKTSLACRLANEGMLGDGRFSDLAGLKALVKPLNQNCGFNLTVPRDHLIFSDFKFYGRKEYYRPTETWDVDGWRLGLPNPHWETSFIPSYSTIYLIEAQRYYDSRRTNTYPLPPWVMRYWERHRHAYLDAFFDCQRPVSIDKGIRGLADRFIFPIKMEHKYDLYGDIIRTVWQCVEINNTNAAEAYSDTKIKPAGSVETEYFFHGNIFRCYNSFGYWDTFYRGRNAQSFTLTKSGVSGRSLAPGSDELHFDYDVPKVFLQKYKELS